MTHRRALTGAVLLLVFAAVPAAVFAGVAASGSGRVDRQLAAASRNLATTSSTGWTDLERLDVGCPSSALATATLSVAMEAGSAPVEVRVRAEPLADLDATPRTAAPGVVPFSVTGADSRTFTFSARVNDADHGRSLVAQWRSPSGEPATITARSMRVLYDAYDGDCL